MQKTLILYVSLALFFFLASSGIPSGIGIEKGNQAPNFTTTNDGATEQLQQFRGKWVVVTFWSTVDAQSRLTNIAQERATRHNSKIQHISVNFDRSKRVWQETVKLDGLNAHSQFYGDSQLANSLASQWKLKNGYASYLIDPNGKIVAANPTEEMLTKI